MFVETSVIVIFALLFIAVGMFIQSVRHDLKDNNNE